jgi:hypothetical protein
MSRERTQVELRETCDKACAILKKTKDGDLLDPSDLKLTEYAVNGHLNESGREVFEKLYQSVVVDGTYIKPYLHDIEHITRNYEGYIYYKGIHVEHYNRDYVYSEAAKQELIELKRKCEFLERKGVEISYNNVIWGWDNYSDEYSVERLKVLDSHLENCSLTYSQVEIYNSGIEYSYFVCGSVEDLAEIKDHPITQSMMGRCFDDEYLITVGSFVYLNGKEVISPSELQDTAEVERLLASCHGYITNKGIIHELPSATYKTDFAKGYENGLKLDKILNELGKSLKYSEVFMYGHGSEQRKLYVIGIPTFDEVKETFEYRYMRELYGNELNVSVTSYKYGEGQPISVAELPCVDTVVELLYENHKYFDKCDLSKEIYWSDYTRSIEVKTQANNGYQTEPKEEAEDGYEL